MNAFFAANRLSNEEKEDILKQHRTLYDGYKTMQPQVSSEQPLYVQDFAKDKVGVVLNNKGVAKAYTNFGINEQVESKHMCEQCGGMMNEKECMECGWKGEVGAMEEEFDDELEFGDEDMEVGDEVSSFDTAGNFLGAVKPNPDMEIEKPNFRPGSDLGKSFEKLKGMMEATGKLSDIYNVSDLGDSEFDYVEGGGNKYGTFEKMHHMKKIKSEDLDDDYEDPDNEDDGFEDLQAQGGEMFEQGMTGGGNAPDMDLSNIEPAYNFVSDGPMAGGDVYPVFEDEDIEEYEHMESAFSDDMELDEANDVSGSQGIYGAMKPAYDFDSKGPGSAGPYQRSSWGGTVTHSDEIDEQPTIDSEMDLDLDLEIDDDDNRDERLEKLSKFDPTNKSWSEINDFLGHDELENLYEDEKEKIILQQKKIMEMFNRMNVIK